MLGNRRTESGSRLQTIIISECMCTMPVPVFSEAKSGSRQGKKCGCYVSKYSKSKKNYMLSVFANFFGFFLTPALGPESSGLNHTSVFEPKVSCWLTQSL